MLSPEAQPTSMPLTHDSKRSNNI